MKLFSFYNFKFRIASKLKLFYFSNLDKKIFIIFLFDLVIGVPGILFVFDEKKILTVVFLYLFPNELCQENLIQVRRVRLERILRLYI